MDPIREPRSTERVLEQRREIRARRGRDLSIAGALESLRREVERSRRDESRIERVWGEVVPAELQRVTRVVGVTRGVLMVRVRDSSSRFMLDRWLRSGGREKLAGAKVNFLRVRVVV
ncbi:MAG: DciA family protein [Phycisphaerales bacterium JB037]